MSTQKRKYELKARAEAQQATRERIAAAAASLHEEGGGAQTTAPHTAPPAASLHEEVGVAKTTVADIARRAGVQRLTVYNHFPDLETLLPACTAHFLGEHPLPDLEAALAREGPADRLGAVLTALYRWYREAASMQRRVLGERAAIPELDAGMAQSQDALLAAL